VKFQETYNPPVQINVEKAMLKFIKDGAIARKQSLNQVKTKVEKLVKKF